VNILFAVYEQEVRPWEGGILTSVCTSFENQDGHGHGIKIEMTFMMPSWSLNVMNWQDGHHFKSLALKYRHMNGFIAVCRDRDTGRVWPDPLSGKPRIEYNASAFDRAHIMTGNIAMAKIAYVTGAKEIHAANSGVPPFVRSSPTPSVEEAEDLGVTDPAFVAWLDEFRRIGNKGIGTIFASAHQMGTCRMSKVESEGVVDPNGQVWGTEGLYVADASVFPSASGVNPMITTMAISDWISRGLAKQLTKEGLA
jgi:choline dehydrogenase-like flavoprotein